MPLNAEEDSERLNKLVQGGGLKTVTLKKRKYFADLLDDFISKKLGKCLADVLTGEPWIMNGLVYAKDLGEIVTWLRSHLVEVWKQNMSLKKPKKDCRRRRKPPYERGHGHEENTASPWDSTASTNQQTAITYKIAIFQIPPPSSGE